LIKEGEIDAIATDIAGEANNAAGTGKFRAVKKRETVKGGLEKEVEIADRRGGNIRGAWTFSQGTHAST
jgi:hypothetical protein